MEVQAEVSVLARTQDILQQEEPTLAEVLQNKNDNDNINEEEIPKDVSVMKQKCKELVTKINILRSDVSTIRKDLQNTKDNMDDLVKIHQTKKEVSKYFIAYIFCYSYYFYIKIVYKILGI